MDGDHGIERCYEATLATLDKVFAELRAHRVVLGGSLLKTNMVLAGKDCPQQAGPEEIADATLRCLREVVPPAVPGVVFLSGGQSDEQATVNLNAMNRRDDHPWELSFSYGRALQTAALKGWSGRSENVVDGQRALLLRARLNSAARSGKYSEDMEREAAA